MAIYISVVSHNHNRIIEQLDCISKLSEEFNVVVKLNTKEDKKYFYMHDNLHVIDEQHGLGFGHNNNFVYSYCKSHLGIKPHDFFIVLNPDVFITVESINTLVSEMLERRVKIGAINLYKEIEFKNHDESIRRFPRLVDFSKSFLGYGNDTLINKDEIIEPSIVDWAAGSFLIFQSSHYEKLGGFDESYFMYCEDIDICHRSQQLNEPVTYFPSIKGVHLAQHSNRKIFSKHFYWHVKSITRYLLSRRGLTSCKSSILNN